MKQVTLYQIKRMKAWEKRVMLSQLGTPSHRLPKSVTDITTMLINQLQERPEEATRWYNAIVLGKLGGEELPDDIAQQVRRAKEEILGTMKDSALTEMLRVGAQNLRDEAKKAETDIIRHAKKAITEAADHYRPIVIKQGNKKRKIKGVFPEEFPRMVQLASQRVPIMLVGPAGCGKTFIAGKVGESLGLESYDQSCSEGISESTFTGWLLSTLR